MKTSRLLLIAAALLGSAALLSAGPSTQFANRSAAPKPATAAVMTAPGNQAAPMVAAANCTTCPCCKKAS